MYQMVWTGIQADNPVKKARYYVVIVYVMYTQHRQNVVAKVVPTILGTIPRHEGIVRFDL